MSNNAWAWILGVLLFAGVLVWLRVVIETWQLGVLRREMREQSDAFLLEAAEIDRERQSIERQMHTLEALRDDIEREAVAMREAHEALAADRAQLDADALAIRDQDAQMETCVRALQEALGLMRCGAHDEAEEVLQGLAGAERR